MEDSISKYRLVIMAGLIVAAYVIAALWLQSLSETPDPTSDVSTPLLRLHNALRLEQ